MSKVKNNFLEVYVISENTGRIIRHAIVNTPEPLLEKVKRYANEDSIVIASMNSSAYCFYIKSESYLITTNTPASFELIKLFREVLLGVYDYARDAYHIAYGRVITLFQVLDDFNCTELLTCIDNIWNTRYYRIAYGKQ